MALLNLWNTPRAEVGSPTQRLFSRRTRALVLVHKKLLQPETIHGALEALFGECNCCKMYADQHTKRAPPTAAGVGRKQKAGLSAGIQWKCIPALCKRKQNGSTALQLPMQRHPSPERLHLQKQGDVKRSSRGHVHLNCTYKQCLSYDSR